MKPKPECLVITCEHAGNRVPAPCKCLFEGDETLLATHRAYDPGARGLAHALARFLGAPMHIAATTRLLVDLNRSPRHPRVFSEITRALPVDQRREILQRYYYPYRSRVESCLRARIRAGTRAIHVSAHSFAPVVNGNTRKADIGLLYDPSREREAILARAWQQALRQGPYGLRVRRNYPYLGKADGFTTYLRGCFAAESYLGIEVELNQVLVDGRGGRYRRILELIAETLLASLEGGVTGVVHASEKPCAIG